MDQSYLRMMMKARHLNHPYSTYKFEWNRPTKINWPNGNFLTYWECIAQKKFKRVKIRTSESVRNTLAF